SSAAGVKTERSSIPSKNNSSATRSEWAPDFTPVSFIPTLSVDITPLSPPSSPPPSRSQNLSTFRRKFSLRSTPPPLHSANSQRPASRPSTSTRSQKSSNTHERRRSKYLNDPT